MPIRPEESLANMIAGLKEKTGKDLDEWTSLISATQLRKHGEIMAFLKGDHALTHGYANQIALRVRDRLDAGASTDGDPIEIIFEKKAVARPIYDALIKELSAFGPDVDLAPKKAYISVRRAKQFAILQPASNRLDVGINLKGVEPTGRLEASGSFNAMLSHRVKVESLADVDQELIDWLHRAYDSAA